MYAQLNEGIGVDIKPHPKKQKTNERSYQIYFKFSIYQNRNLQSSPVISTGIKVDVKEWENDKMRGNSDNARFINERLAKYMSLSIKSIDQLGLREQITCKEIINHVKTSIKLKLTGKAPRGLKEEFKLKAHDYTIESVLKLYFLKSDAPCIKRQNNYGVAFSYLHEYFENDTPLINNITKSDLNNFKDWFHKKYGSQIKQNTATTYFAMIAATFLYAYKKLEIIKTFPLPENFRGSFVDGDRVILSNHEVKQIIYLEDEKLSTVHQRAKYCMLLQLLTGIGYGDLKSLTRNHRKFNTDFQQWMITKHRNKTGIEFSVRQSEMCNHVYDKLREISGGQETEFALPSIDYSLTKYKEVAKMAGITSNVGTYTMRHSFAQDYMNNGGVLEILQKMLGHKKITTTQTYGKVSPIRINAAMKQLEEKSERHRLPNEINTKGKK